jgi:hypothetical protein
MQLPMRSCILTVVAHSLDLHSNELACRSMHITLLTLVRGEDTEIVSINPDVLIDALWAFSPVDDGLEHVRARCAAGRIDLVFFHLADVPAARDRATSLCRRTILNSPLLHGWRLTEDLP